VKRLTADSSVIVSSLLKGEKRHKEALKIWNAVLAGKTTAIMPYSVFVEVVAAVRRRTGSEELAREVGKQLLRLETAFFVAVDDKAAWEAAELAVKTAVRSRSSFAAVRLARELSIRSAICHRFFVLG
jgi:predicted nucleic acid-binding protein